jgi:hypothetical protein
MPASNRTAQRRAKPRSLVIAGLLRLVRRLRKEGSVPRAAERNRIDSTDARLTLQDWLGAALAMGALFAGAVVTLGIAYWLFTGR